MLAVESHWNPFPDRLLSSSAPLTTTLPPALHKREASRRGKGQALHV